MASRRHWRPRRTRPEPGAVRAALDFYGALSGKVEAERDVPGVVARLWAAATCADGTPARIYLSRRECWPGPHVPGAPALPESVRWLARAEAPDCDPAAGWCGMPAGANGAVVLAWWPARRASNSDPVAVTLVALDARGFPVREVRCTVGTCAGAVFRAGDWRDEAALRVEADTEGRAHANGWRNTRWLEVLGEARGDAAALGAAAGGFDGHAKGEPVSVSGRLQLSTYAGRDGEERESWQCVADAVVSSRSVFDRRAGGAPATDAASRKPSRLQRARRH